MFEPTPTIGDLIVADIDKAALAANPPRHSWRVKPSDIAEPCHAKLWYVWRWAKRGSYSGQIARLFKRGHKAEAGLSDWLRASGWEILDLDPETGKQFRVKDFNGHLSGYLDGMGRHPVYSNNEWIIIEYKTYKEKLWNELKKQKVKLHDPKYYGQMVLYMKYRNVSKCLFLAVNKNDDKIHPEMIERDDGAANELIQVADTIINSNIRPMRISMQITDFRCKYCTFNEICHEGAPVETNCRSCLNSVPIEGGKFACKEWMIVLTAETMAVGCAKHSPIS